VSIGAELTFDRLITAVDDFGRFDARREMLKAALFPVRADAPPELVMEWIRELANEGCVRLYEVEDRPYLCLPGWEKHRGNQRRRKASVYPDPPRGRSNARKPMPRKSGNPPEVTAGVGVGVGVGLGDGVGVGVKSDPPKSEVIESSKTAVTSVEPGLNPKRKTRCPENLTAKQWGQVHTWRDKKHPEFSNRELKAQWERHANHHINKGEPGLDWVRSFYNWLTGDFYKPLTRSESNEPAHRAWTPDEGTHKLTPEEIEERAAEFRKLRVGERKKKRARQAKATTDPPDDVDERVDDASF
jgi:hypothetical protein